MIGRMICIEPLIELYICGPILKVVIPSNKVESCRMETTLPDKLSHLMTDHDYDKASRFA